MKAMAAQREFAGDSLDEALRVASEALNVRVEDVHYEMLEEGRKGVFGLGARPVRIRVELPAEDARRPAPPKPAGPATGPPPEREEPSTEAESSAAERSVRETLERMFSLMGVHLQVRTRAAGANLRVQLSGPDRKLLLQKDAQLLSAVAFLLNRMARRAWPEVGRIQVQCDGQRSRRDEDLVALVREVASQVARTGRAKELHPMNPYERRLVHITVRDFPELTSRSEGDGFLKRIVVSKTS
jgi:spoIIIJ-associated protein